ncbi:hypothetical protein AO715_02850 [Xanthomonas sp. Mitacek01]|nr:hypothetical protein AO715_02850 [Xanthomonas sp. Mitacek01]
MTADAAIAADIRLLLSDRAPDASICPSEVARRLWPGDAWREAMPNVRRVAARLADVGVIRITQSDAELDPASPMTGPIRLRRGPRWLD